MSTRKLHLIMMFTCTAFSSAWAQATDKDVIDRWFVALQARDIAALDPLIADNASFSIEDNDVTYSKPDVLDQLRKEVADAEGPWVIKYQTDVTRVPVTVMVCYDLNGLSLYRRETYTVYDGRIEKVSQKRLTGDCPAL